MCIFCPCSTSHNPRKWLIIYRKVVPMLVLLQCITNNTTFKKSGHSVGFVGYFVKVLMVWVVSTHTDDLLGSEIYGLARWFNPLAGKYPIQDTLCTCFCWFIWDVFSNTCGLLLVDTFFLYSFASIIVFYLSASIPSEQKNVLKQV